MAPRLVTFAILLTAAASGQTALRIRLKPAVDSTVIEMSLERYVAAVVAAEAGSLASGEALKAMAVAARTYAVYFRGRHKDEGYDLCGTTHCQRAEPSMVNSRVEAAVQATAGELLWYRGSPVLAAYSRDCGGVTEDAAAVWPGIQAPYLSSHADPYCTRAASPPWHWSARADEIAAALARSGLRAPRHLSGIVIARRTASGRAGELALTGGGESVRVAAGSFRLAIGRALGFATVRGERWEARAANGRIEFEGRGEGHGVGLCQRGADRMGQEGKSWRDILAFYYPGAEAGRSARAINWTRLSGETLSLWTTQPSQDGALLASAAHAARELAARTGWLPPPGIELRVYPDLAAFRNATGEPGWVAAHTTGRRIDLQPAAILRARGALESTLRHEIAHVFVESQAAPGLPLWFREGLAAYLSGGPARGSGAANDQDISQTADEARARAANRAAAARVAALVDRHGLPPVLSWLHTGIP
ncbi:MAG: SpoIID/LytB domain-containing protein [Acidobacteria bacterium]|nr:SpoIID/LytB domain-containing protein [Acidobacteriota bacterium]